MSLLPLIAALALSSLKRQGSNSGLLDQLLGGILGGGRSTTGASAGGGLLGGLLGKILGGGRKKKKVSSSPLDALGGLLDADGEGSVIDDLLGFAKKAL